MTPPKVPYLRYDREIGTGGMSTVWHAWHLELKREVAVKVLNADFAASGQDVRRFMLESRAMCALDHPGLVRGFGADCAEGRYFYVMEYVDGYTLATHLARKNRMPWCDVIWVCESVAQALKYAWDAAKLVHCDIKPENLMLTREGVVKITDLGLCQSQAALQSQSDSDEIFGTPAYLSPEQIYGDEPLDCRADIYLLGGTLYHLVTGRVLFPVLTSDETIRAHVDESKRAPDPRTVDASIPAGFVHLLAGMLAKERTQRYQTWDEVLTAAQYVEAGGELPPPPSELIASMQVGVPR